jgi:pimeloyl-ACP methyl ester carboxylesterase
MIRAEHCEIDGAVGYVERAGAGTPVLCIHSAGQSGVQWRSVLRRLPALGYEVIVPDMPGHGRSDHALGGPIADLRTYSEWLVALLGCLGIERPFVVGCSIGGKIALELALDEALAPRAVVAMAADAHNDRLSLEGLRRGLEDAASPSRGDRTYYGTLVSVGRDVPAERAAAIAAMHRREDPVVSTADLIGWTVHDLRERIGAIPCPVRLVAGADDFWLDLTATRWTAEQIPHCTYDERQGVGHYPMEEIESFPELLDQWLRELTLDTEGDEAWAASK